MLQAALLDSLAFNRFALFEDGFDFAEVGVGWRHVVETLVIAPVVVMLDQGADLDVKVAGQEVIFQEDSVLQCLMPALNLALGLGMHRGGRTWLIRSSSI